MFHTLPECSLPNRFFIYDIRIHHQQKHLSTKTTPNNSSSSAKYHLSYLTQKILKKCLVSSSQLKQISSKVIFKKQLIEVHTTKNSKGIKILIVHQLKRSKTIGFFSQKLFLQETKALTLTLNFLSTP